MPQMGSRVAEGTIVEWRKRPGDWVEADETICRRHHRQDRRRDPVAGERARSRRILVEPGETRRRSGRRSLRSTPERDGRARPHPDERHDEPTGHAPARSRDRRGEADRSGFYSPVVRRIADKHGIDLAQVEGTGIGGRVRKRDVLAHDRVGHANGDGQQNAGARPPHRVALPARTRRPAAPEPNGEHRPTDDRRERRAPRADDADAPGDRRAHGRRAAAPRRTARRSSRSTCHAGRGAPRASSRRAMARRGVAAHLPRLRGARDGRGARASTRC